VKVYLCAAWQRQAQLRGYRDRLVAAGVAVTSSWLDLTGPLPTTAEEARAAALLDLGDLDRADEVVAFTELPAIGYLTGGRHVEVGYALAVGKPIWLVGPPENVFHHHPLVSHADQFETVLDAYLRRTVA
jgi:nucleoside 2-deoxyribosyltransferase